MATAAFQNKSDRAAWTVIGLTVIALALGWGLKTFVDGRSTTTTTGGVSVAAPFGYLVQHEGPLTGFAKDPSRVITLRNPLDPGTVYAVSLYPAGDTPDLATTASLRNLQRAQILTAYRIIDQTPVTLKGRDGYRVTFAFVDASAQDRAPIVYHGLDYFFIESDQVLVATLETSQDFEDAIEKFRDFAAAVHLGE